MSVKSVKQQRLRKINGELIPDVNRRIKECAALGSELQKEKNKLEKEAVEIALALNPPKKSEPTVSDHALVRYLEREHGFNFTQYREEILTPQRRQAIEMGCREIKCGKLRMKIENNTIVTVID